MTMDYGLLLIFAPSLSKDYHAKHTGVKSFFGYSAKGRDPYAF
jgi:hypothetical protein